MPGPLSRVLLGDVEPAASASCSHIPDQAAKAQEEAIESSEGRGSLGASPARLGLPRTRKLSLSTPDISSDSATSSQTKDSCQTKDAMFSIGPQGDLLPSQPSDLIAPFSSFRLPHSMFDRRSQSQLGELAASGTASAGTTPRRAASEVAAKEMEAEKRPKRHPLLDMFLSSSSFLSKPTQLSFRELNALNID